MAELFWAFVLLLIVACFWAAVSATVVALLVLLGVLTALCLPPLIVGFVRGFRAERKARDSNPEGN